MFRKFVAMRWEGALKILGNAGPSHLAMGVPDSQEHAPLRYHAEFGRSIGQTILAYERRVAEKNWTPHDPSFKVAQGHRRWYRSIGFCEAGWRQKTTVMGMGVDFGDPDPLKTCNRCQNMFSSLDWLRPPYFTTDLRHWWWGPEKAWWYL